MVGNGIENGQQLAHAGGQSQFLWLPGGQQPLIERANERIELGGN
jgi:hypothetical protein